MGGWGHWMYEHRVFKYLYLCLGTAWVFGQAIVTHFPGRQRGGQGEAGPGCRVVRHGTKTLSDRRVVFRTMHATLLTVPVGSLGVHTAGVDQDGVASSGGVDDVPGLDGSASASAGPAAAAMVASRSGMRFFSHPASSSLNSLWMRSRH